MATEDFAHRPVMPDEVLHWLQPKENGLYLDGTLGGAGHAKLILENAAGSRLIGLDRDPAALREAARILAPFAERISLHHTTFDRADEVIARLQVEALDGILLDLGVSSHQLDTPERGFSFQHDAPLDMRMDPGQGQTAADVVNQTEEGELRRIFFDYGEERFSRRIAREIVQRRIRQPFSMTGELAELIQQLVPGGRRSTRIHPATRVFQALRIQVNDELGQVQRGVKRAISLLQPGGRLVVISFHSLEDRIVKRLFRERATDCVCPPKLPVCQCGKTADARILTRKVVRASDAEIAANPRARSALLRAVERY